MMLYGAYPTGPTLPLAAITPYGTMGLGCDMPNPRWRWSVPANSAAGIRGVRSLVSYALLLELPVAVDVRQEGITPLCRGRT